MCWTASEALRSLSIVSTRKFGRRSGCGASLGRGRKGQPRRTVMLGLGPSYERTQQACRVAFQAEEPRASPGATHGRGRRSGDAQDREARIF